MTLWLPPGPSSSVSLDVAPSLSSSSSSSYCLLSRRLLRSCSLLAALLKGFSLCTLKVPLGTVCLAGLASSGLRSSSVSDSESLGGTSPAANTFLRH